MYKAPCKAFEIHQIQIWTSRNLQSYMKHKTCWFSTYLPRTYRASGPVLGSREVTMNGHSPGTRVETKKCIWTAECAEVSTLLPWSVRERAARARVPKPPGLWPSDARAFQEAAATQHGSGEEFGCQSSWHKELKGWWDIHFRVGVRKDFKLRQPMMLMNWASWQEFVQAEKPECLRTKERPNRM